MASFHIYYNSIDFSQFFIINILLYFLVLVAVILVKFTALLLYSISIPASIIQYRPGSDVDIRQLRLCDFHTWNFYFKLHLKIHEVCLKTILTCSYVH